MLLFDYNKAMRQVRELNAIAAEMSNTKRKLENDTLMLVQKAWEGQTAQQFIEKCRRLIIKIDSEIRSIKQVASSLEYTAKIIEEAERKAAQILLN